MPIFKQVHTIEVLMECEDMEEAEQVRQFVDESEMAQNIEQGLWLGMHSVSAPVLVPAEDVAAECESMGGRDDFFDNED